MVKRHASTNGSRDTKGFRQFAERRRLRVRHDACGDPFISGKFGHLYPHGAGRFGMVLEEPANRASRPRILLARRRQAVAAGFTLHQQGDVESILLFTPGNGQQERLAIRLVRAKTRRKCSPAQLAVLKKFKMPSRIAQTLATEAPQPLGATQRAGTGEHSPFSPCPVAVVGSRDAFHVGDGR